MSIPQNVRRISDVVWEIPTSYKDGMRVPARIYASESLLSELDETVYDQITNVATLPGVFKHALCMPEMVTPDMGFPLAASRRWMLKMAA
jgi:tRNA-splicing ligase RtcB